jgi:hypothetical protein
VKSDNPIIGFSFLLIFSDFQFALLPLTFVFTLSRPLRERIVIACIMSMGLLASAVGCLKYIEFYRVFNTTDPTYDMVTWKVASIGESNIGVIAACLPPLKSLFEDSFKRLISKKSPGDQLPTDLDYTFVHVEKGQWEAEAATPPLKKNDASDSEH